MHLSEFEDAYDDLELFRGAILTTPISDLRLRVPVAVRADDTVVKAVNLMNEQRTGSVLVEREGKIVGIFTEQDVLRRVIFRDNNRSMQVGTVMTPNPETLEPTASIAYALNKMSVGGFRRIPIVDKNGLALGVVSIRDITDFLVKLFPTGVLNLPDHPEMSIPKTKEGG